MNSSESESMMPRPRITIPSDLFFPSPQITGDSRRCDNCISHSTCWASGEEMPQRPENFALKTGWDIQRMISHMKRIYGQICGNFHSDNQELERHFNKPPAGWDYEENKQ